jgi:hypothetical protein
MVLTALILTALVLSFMFSVGLVMMVSEKGFKYSIKFMYSEDWIDVYLGLQLCFFLVFFLASAATYNTFIDKSNPNYYKNQTNGNTGKIHNRKD